MNARETLKQMLTSGKTVEADRASSLQLLNERIAALHMGSPKSGLDHFRSRAEENGARVMMCKSIEDLPVVLNKLCPEAKKIALARDPAFEQANLESNLLMGKADRSVMYIDDRCFQKDQDTWKRAYADLDVGLNRAVVGIADSGAVLIAASENDSRALSLLSVHHVVILHVRDILASLSESAPVLRKYARKDVSSALTLIGGPSKTADIEKVLVTGVHGPKDFTIIIIDEV